MSNTLRSHFFFSFASDKPFNTAFFNQQFSIDSAEGTERGGVQYVHVRVAKQIKWTRVERAVAEYNKCDLRMKLLKMDSDASQFIKEDIGSKSYWLWQVFVNFCVSLYHCLNDCCRNLSTSAPPIRSLATSSHGSST